MGAAVSLDYGFSQLDLYSKKEVNFVNFMHAIKGGWVGQPFALAKHNESEGRKTRIRRSKEERKTMVEAFIKKYQELNSGSFPSLNLTHKEVGGSFYTVREIVRDIIQENRVLGPGKLLLEEQSTDLSLEENPLDSIAIEPQSPLTLSSKEADFPANYNQYTSEEKIHVSDEHCTPTNIHVPHNEPVINGRLKDVSNGGSDENTKLQGNEHNEVEDRVKEESGVSITQVTPLASDVVVETFPLRPISGAISKPDGGSETWVSIGDVDKQVNQTTELKSEVGLFDIEGNSSSKTSSLVDEKAVNFASALSEKSDLVEVAPVELGEPIVEKESSNGSILREGSKHEVQGPRSDGCADTPTCVTFEQGQKSNELKAANAPSGTQNLNETFNIGIDQASKIKEETEVENKVDAQQNGGSQKESIPTLNRINLESWEGTSKNSSKPENNPLLAIFKAFVAAFVKFWSE